MNPDDHHNKPSHFASSPPPEDAAATGPPHESEDDAVGSKPDNQSLFAADVEAGEIDPNPEDEPEADFKETPELEDIAPSYEADRDTAILAREPSGETPPELAPLEWEPNASARKVALELKQIEEEIRRLLENCDNKRKRRYEGTRRWLELQEDILAMRFVGPADEATLNKVQALVAKRHHLFRRLNFIVGTRHRWNT